MKADWKDPSDAPMSVRLMVSSSGYGHHHGKVSMATRVDMVTWADEDRRICNTPSGWDYMPDAIDLAEVQEIRARALRAKL